VTHRGKVASGDTPRQGRAQKRLPPACLARARIATHFRAAAMCLHNFLAASVQTSNHPCNAGPATAVTNRAPHQSLPLPQSDDKMQYKCEKEGPCSEHAMASRPHVAATWVATQPQLHAQIPHFGPAYSKYLHGVGKLSQKVACTLNQHLQGLNFNHTTY
jgi:hypothetical protein